MVEHKILRGRDIDAKRKVCIYAVHASVRPLIDGLPNALKEILRINVLFAQFDDDVIDAGYACRVDCDCIGALCAHRKTDARR